MEVAIKTIFFALYFFFASSSLFSNQLINEYLEERKFDTKGLIYLLKAEQKTTDFDKLKKLNLFNRKHIISNAIYYDNGTLYKKNIKVDFKRAYFFEGDLHMENCYSFFEGATIKAKFAVYKKTHIEFKDLILKKDNVTYHKFKYEVETF